MLALLSIAAWGAVRTQDDPGCLDDEQLDLELGSLLGDQVTDDVDLFARVSGEEELAVEVRVSRRGELLWERTLAVQRVDCPLLPSLVARSVAAGLQELPGWQIQARRAVAAPELQVVASVTVPFAPRFGLGGRWLGVIHGPIRFGVDLEGGWSLVQPLQQGGVQVASIALAAGPVAAVPVRRDAIQLGLRASLGPAIVTGRGFVENYSTVAPRVGALGEAIFASHALLRVGVRGELPITRLSWTLPDTGESTLEPAFRVGLVLGIGSTYASGEAERSDRP